MVVIMVVIMDVMLVIINTKKNIMKVAATVRSTSFVLSKITQAPTKVTKYHKPETTNQARTMQKERPKVE
jgi:hypothetical protein